MGADDLDAETLKRLKREAAIRSKEQDFERRKKGGRAKETRTASGFARRV